MHLLLTVAALKDFLRQTNPNRQHSLGFVPTMGALHDGHLSLIQRAREENEQVVVSIFVNSLQFGSQEDLDRYPRTLDQDQQLCDQAGVDGLFLPTNAEIYGPAYEAEGPDSITRVIPPTSLMHTLCGLSRPGHFQGVATVVTKLLNLVQPTRAYFGQKDAQQAAIVERLVRDLHLPVTIVSCPIVRQASGLALSSRNQYLTPTQHHQASVLYRSLQAALQDFRHGQRQTQLLIARVQAVLATEPAVVPEYVALVHPQTLVPLTEVAEAGLLGIAAQLDTTRLIDNMVLRYRKPIVAIDGPAGVGKSTVTRRLAQTLGLLHLDTGAMYRAVTWLVLNQNIPLADEGAIATLAQDCTLQLIAHRSPQAPVTVWINGHDVTHAIRSQEITRQVSTLAAQSGVRRALVQQQQQYGELGGIVAEGRDIGTRVFPDADLKIFLTASVQERARRRHQDLQNQGLVAMELTELEAAIASRDQQDSSRVIAPLRPAPDAIEISTDGFSVDEVTEKIVQLYQTRVQAMVPEPTPCPHDS